MTLVAFVLSVILGTGALALGFYRAEFFDGARWSILLGIVWVLSHWRRLYWVSSLAFLLVVIGAAYGVWNNFTTF